MFIGVGRMLHENKHLVGISLAGSGRTGWAKLLLGEGAAGDGPPSHISRKVLLVSNLVMKFKKNKLEMYIKCSSSRFGTLILFFFMYFPANEKSINERKCYTISYICLYGSV